MALYGPSQLASISSSLADVAEDRHWERPAVVAAHADPYGDNVRLELILEAPNDETAAFLSNRLRGPIGSAAGATQHLGVTVLQHPHITTGLVRVFAPPYPPPPLPPYPPRAPPPPPIEPPAAPPAPPRIPPPAEPPTAPVVPFSGAFAVLVVLMGLVLLVLTAVLAFFCVRALARCTKPVRVGIKRPSPRSGAGTRGAAEGDGVEMNSVSPDPHRSPISEPPVQALTPQEVLVRLADAVSERLNTPQLQPPAWQLFLETVYIQMPPQTLTHRASAGEAAALAQIPHMSAGVLRALRRALVYYHPDRNLEGEYGREWAGVAEEVSKMATQLHDHYKRHISTATSETLDDVDD